VSNISLSLFEDLSVAGLMALALAYPALTVVVVAVLVVAAAAVTLWLFRFLRRGSRAVRRKFRAIRSRI
jgi:hypothetical protein